ncbi:MAG: hypothetical protein ETSY1_28835 [Candidatus Entotheonella factor]|uniref:Uncharacterized protein n=1 Tax=Entotheonella factor TaxID=1429438 RepID=W4LEX2_ENTF1|nr:hypothetical protein [Candidatus Entotheonella palauensis]ETW95871.1 MAG: hypothetical protein ETSY1_28835 [Candidatus Entotheonella factor]
MFHTRRDWGLKNRWLAAAMVLSLLPLASLHAQSRAEKPINVGTLESASPRPASEAVVDRPDEKIEPSHRFEFAAHAANGVAMRNRTSGTIHLRGIPIRSTPLRAMLYFNFSDGSREGRDSSPVLFNGNVVTAQKTGDHDDPCWGQVGNHSYVADVTAFMPISGALNQDYDVVIPFDDTTSTTGQNPWSPFTNQNVLMEGATLVVIYRSSDTTGAVYLYDALSNAMFAGTATFTLTHGTHTSPGLFTMVGADGQRGNTGHDNTVSNELTFFNGTQIAGPPVASSDWDGSDGWPLVQLWDTHTHIVKLEGEASQVTYQANGDCLVPVAFVIDAD